MADPTTETLAKIVSRAESGDAAAKEELFAALYHDLHRLAEGHLRGASGSVTLSATTLLHEAYLGIAQRDSLAFPDRARFFAYASRAMRWIVLDYVRRRRALKRGGELTIVAVDEEDVAAPEATADLERLDAALRDLARLQPDLAELVDLRFFCGLSFAEIATLRGVSERTAQRDWAKARALLFDSLKEA